MRMVYQQVTVTADAMGREALGGILDALGVAQYEIIEETEVIAAFLNEMAPYWDYVDDTVLTSAGTPGIRFYVPEGEEADALIAALTREVAVLRDQPWAAGIGAMRVQAARVDEEDWANNWKQYYKPILIGERLLIRPEWEEAAASERIVLTLNPGMVFGTGQHETTALCLMELEARVKQDMCVTDVGCGSGILAIASLLLGGWHARGIDIDPLAEDIVRENARLNGIVSDKLDVLSGNVLEDASLLGEDDSADIVVANIVADVIVPLSSLVPRVLKKDGLYIASGIITDRLADVRRAMEEAGFEVIKTAQQRDWVAVVAQRKGR